MAKDKKTTTEAEVPDLEVNESSAVTVITNTVESIRGHYPKIAADIEAEAVAKAKPEWQKEERERLAALNAAFADDPKFANDSFVAGLTVEQAKAKRHDEIAAKLKTVNEENAKLKAQSEVPFVASDDQSKSGSEIDPSAEPMSDVKREATANWNKDKGIRDEFMDFDTYFAFYKNRGSVKLLRRDVAVE